MSLSETETETSPELLAEVRELRGQVAALHEEICYMRGRWPHLEDRVTDMHNTLQEFRPVLDRFSTVTGSRAAGWARNRGRDQQPGTHQCQGYRHEVPVESINVPVCYRTDSHRWSAELGCHSVSPACRG